MINNKIRVFPTLTINNGDLVKTKKYFKPNYLGDPINAIKILNNKSVDEICILDISSNHSKIKKEINYKLLGEMATEAFVPLSYGGNIENLKQCKEIINLGYEKVVINSLFHKNLNEVINITNELGSQSVVLKIDYVFENNKFYYFSMGKKFNEISFIGLVDRIKLSNVGELILSRVDFDGAMNRYDISKFTTFMLSNLNIPIVLSNGAKDEFSIVEPYKLGFTNFTASSAYVYVGKIFGILINNPFENYNINDL